MARRKSAARGERRAAAAESSDYFVKIQEPGPRMCILKVYTTRPLIKLSKCAGHVPA
jgi:hypothetical protein